MREAWATEGERWRSKREGGVSERERIRERKWRERKWRKENEGKKIKGSIVVGVDNAQIKQKQEQQLK